MESLINLAVNKMIIMPEMEKIKSLDHEKFKRSFITTEQGTINGMLKAPSKELNDLEINLNLTFSEPSSNHNLSEQLSARSFLAEYCFEKL
jgi:hypothetical protein